MRKRSAIFLFILSLIISHSAFALLSLELTHGVAGAVPITIKPFDISGGMPPQDVSAIISHDLQNSGRFKLASGDASNVVVGRVASVGGDLYQVSFKLLDTYKGKGGDVLVGHEFTVTGGQLRALAHHISDMVYEQILGVRGIFSTRLAYVVVQKRPNAPTQYLLEVADQDGYNPKPLLTSTDPIMSPSWSPNGKEIAYVSFEGRRASIYVERVATGERRLISQFPGINGAPAWSKDGRKLAIVLSKSGSPNIYVLDINSRSLKQVTNDWSINTEPSWSPDGRSIIFTSNRGGGPQIYQVNLSTGATSRVSYDGDYNARASYTPDGNHIIMLHKESGMYTIGVLDLDTSSFRVLTDSHRDADSPSVAPNGSMVLFGTSSGGRAVLGMVSSDGGVQLVLPARNGEVQDPAWSPYLS